MLIEQILPNKVYFKVTMIKHRFIHQPSSDSHADALLEMIDEPGVEVLRAGIAYVTDSGVTSILQKIDSNNSMRQRWENTRKKWLVGIDWLRSEPTALDRLSNMPRAEVRIHNGMEVLSTAGCVPRVPWHPKIFIASGSQLRGVLHGSANLSRNGMNRGFEIGSLQVVVNPQSAHERNLWDSLNSNNLWFDALWKNSCPLARIANEYQIKHQSEALKRVTLIEDDTGAGQPSDPSQTEKNAAMRAATRLWINSGKLSKNRGPTVPGNQLMMSAMTRVFFGFPPDAQPKDTHLGYVYIQHPVSGDIEKKPMRYSNNAMDVLTLPLPHSPWPQSYDDEFLLFTKRSNGVRLEYSLKIGGKSEIETWKRKSKRLGTSYRMRGQGREWGVL